MASSLISASLAWNVARKVETLSATFALDRRNEFPPAQVEMTS